MAAGCEMFVDSQDASHLPHIGITSHPHMGPTTWKTGIVTFIRQGGADTS